MIDHAGLPIAVNRSLNAGEERLLEWLLKHGTIVGRGFLSQVPLARVVATCSCGCASFLLSVNGKIPASKAQNTIAADFRWESKDGRKFAAIAYARESMLAGVDLWPLDGGAASPELPAPERLVISPGY